MTTIPVSEHGNVYLLALLVANSSTFRAIPDIAAADADEALSRIYYPWAETDSGEIPSRAVISDDADLSRDEWTRVSRGNWSHRETLALTFDLLIPADVAGERCAKQEWAWFLKTVKGILSDMRSLAGTGSSGVNSTTHFNMLDFQKINGSYRADPSEMSPLTDPEKGIPLPFWTVTYEVEHQ